MARHVVIRTGANEEKVVAETHLPAEANLHDVLMDHSELLPAEDIGLGRVVVVGRESSLTPGPPDLIYLDDEGEVCLVEVKKEGNADTRRVVAQLLDYASDLWGKSLDEFERDVVHPYLVKYEKSATGLRELLLEAFRPDDADDDELGALSDVTAIEAALAKTLVTGKFRLVVAIPVIPEGIQQVLRYLNAQGLRLYGLEVSYFVEESSVQGQVECFVPRLVVRPEDSVVVPPSKTGIDWTRELVLKELSSDEAQIAQLLFEWADGLGLEDWPGHHGTTLGYWTPNLKDGSGYMMMPFALGTNGRITINFGNMAYAPYPPFDSEGKRRKLQQELNSLGGIQIRDEKIDKWPSFKLQILGDEETRAEFFRIIGWTLDQAKEAHAGQTPFPQADPALAP